MKTIGNIKSIWIYPIKSLDGTEVNESKLNKGGGLVNDRVFALKDLKGEYINAKNKPEIIKIRTKYDLNNQLISLSLGDSDLKFSLEDDKRLIEEWFSDYVNKKVQLDKNENIGFPDDTERSGPTVYSYQSLQLVQSWFPDLSIEEIRRRFRGNIELNADKEGFWEDELLNSDKEPGHFQINDLDFKAIKPCPRCPVPSRDSISSEIYSGFQKRFTKMRQEHYAKERDNKLYPHYYMFALNTIVTNPDKGLIKKGANLMID